jgi:hypothetical protein
LAKSRVGGGERFLRVSVASYHVSTLESLSECLQANPCHLADLAYLLDNPSAALPPSPLTPESIGRPRAPTPSASFPDEMSSYVLDSPTSLSSRSSPPMNHAPLFRSAAGESPFLPPDYDPSHSFARPQKSMVLPDPSQFPDPYLFRPPHHRLNSNSTPPALSSRGSSSASTRSSANTSSGSGLVSGDYENEVIVASGDDEEVNVGVGITSDDVVHLLAGNGNASIPSQSRIPIDQARWSESYSNGVRSRSSSVAFGVSNSGNENGSPGLDHKPSFDIGWQAVDEREEEGLISDDETDEDHNLPDAEDEDEEEEDERTAAAVIAEEGRGLIVKGDGLPISDIQVEPGKMPCAARSNLSDIYLRHYSSTRRFIKYTQLSAFMPFQCHPGNIYYPSSSGCLCEFPWRTSPLFSWLLYS